MSKDIIYFDDTDSDYSDAEPDYVKRSNSPENECGFCMEYGHVWYECPDYKRMVEKGKHRLGINVPVICKFCKGNHPKEKCQILKTSLCPSCGLIGHTENVCNKIAIGPHGEVGKCTFKACKGAEKWGHWMVNCPKRQKEQGPYEFKEGEDPIKAYAKPDKKLVLKRIKMKK